MHCVLTGPEHACSKVHSACLRVLTLRTIVHICRSLISQHQQHTAKLQKQLDSAQADLQKAASQMKQEQDAKAGLGQQLKQVTEQLSASQQKKTQVSRQCHCVFTTGESESSVTHAILGKYPFAHDWMYPSAHD